MWRSPHIISEANIIDEVNIICRRQTSLKKTVTFYQSYGLFLAEMEFCHSYAQCLAILTGCKARRKRFANRIYFTGCPTSGAVFYLPFLTCSPVNGSTYSCKLTWSFAISSCNCFFIYSCIAFLFLPTVST